MLFGTAERLSVNLLWFRLADAYMSPSSFCQNKSSIYYANENMKVLVAVGKDLKTTSKMTNMSIKAIGYRLKHKQRSRGDKAIDFFFFF